MCCWWAQNSLQMGAEILIGLAGGGALRRSFLQLERKWAVLLRAGPKRTSLCRYSLDRKVTSDGNFELTLFE